MSNVQIATAQIAAEKMTPVSSTAPVIPHHVEIGGFMQMLSYKPGIDAEFQITLVNALRDGLDWVRGLAKLANSRVSEAPQKAAKALGSTSWQKTRKEVSQEVWRSLAYAELRKAANAYQGMKDRLTFFKNIYGAASLYMSSDEAEANAASDFLAALGIHVFADNTLDDVYSVPAFNSLKEANAEARALLGSRKWDGTPKTARDDDDDSESDAMQRAVMNKVLESQNIKATQLLTMSEEGRAALAKAVEEGVKAEQVKAELAARMRLVEAWTTDLLKLCGDSKEKAAEFLTLVRSKLDEPTVAGGPEALI